MRKLILQLSILIVYSLPVFGQTEITVLTKDDFKANQSIFLAEKGNWYFRKGHNPDWGKTTTDFSNWQELKPSEITKEFEDENGRIEGWFKTKLKLDASLEGIPLSISRTLWASTDVYVDGELFHAFGNTGNPYEAYNPVLKYPVPIDLEIGKVYELAIHFVDYETSLTQREIRLKPENLKRFINLTGPDYKTWVETDKKKTYVYGALSIGITFLLCLLFWLLSGLNKDQKIFRHIAFFFTVLCITAVGLFLGYFVELGYSAEKIRFFIAVTFQAVAVIYGFLILEWVLTQRISWVSVALLISLVTTSTYAHLFTVSWPFTLVFITLVTYFTRLFYKHRASIRGINLVLLLAIIIPIATNFVYIAIHKYSLDFFNEYEKLIYAIIVLTAPFCLLVYISVRFKEILKEVEEEASKVIQVTNEKRELLANQNQVLERQVKERTASLNQSLEELKATQSQLIQSEKMASLGELTAGIAHEIQNPLNFVNNFSEVSSELIDEMNEELENGDLEEVKAIASDIKQNLEKIKYHGKRADSIVKGMLQHSRTTSGEKEPTDLNKLADEYMRLAYHGLRAKDKGFNATLQTEFDADLGLISMVPQEIGRVILNLFTNAFYAVDEKQKSLNPDEKASYAPTVSVATEKQSDIAKLIIKDNGNGIPKHVLDKIFEPFFTTKPTGKGTGLGLSMSYDIIKNHGGTINVKTEQGEFTAFEISLPIKT
ncbi:ATP-binding protein [Winogradskyella maritima]|uniref:histidine kinase n=1 Tax=Winogradskyella maritima TaxID=1517766 RepID=A0ABV8AJC4_9FLAO|nr:ATP-binding protein [Winogradskyella maritima]